MIKYAENTEVNYENFIAYCPECGYRNIFNRVSDLGTTQPISFKEVRCESCKETFGINGDLISPSHQMILFDCYALRKEKRYSACILLLVQALEVLFYHYLKVELVYRPFWKENKHDIENVNSALNALQSEVEKLAYGQLKNIFLNWVVKESKIFYLNDSISKIKGLKKKYSDRPPENDALKENISDPILVDLLIKLKDCRVDKLRNKVVHKEAYRPSREEVDNAISQVRDLIVNLTRHLDINGSDINSFYPEGSCTDA